MHYVYLLKSESFADERYTPPSIVPCLIAAV
jgi:hypothetical protein